MSPSLKEFASTALKLPLKERAELAEALLASLDDLEDAENESLWAEEAEKRCQAYREGRGAARPAEDVLRDARRRIA